MSQYHKNATKCTNSTVNSEDRISPELNSTNDCQIELHYTVDKPQQIACKGISIDYSVYNVRNGLRNYFIDIREGVTIYQVSIAPGVYTIPNFAIALEEALNTYTGSGTYTVTVVYPLISGTINSSFYFQISNSTIIFDILWSTGPNSAENFKLLLGFTVDVTGLTIYSGSSFITAVVKTITLFNYNYSRFEVQDPGFSYCAILVEGNYTGTTLATQLQTQLNTASASAGSAVTYVVGYSGVSFKFTITATALITILSYTGTNRYSSIYKLTGFVTYINHTGTAVYVSDFAPCIYGEKYGYLTCDLSLGNTGQILDTSTLVEHNPLRYESILFKFHITVLPGNGFIYETDSPIFLNLLGSMNSTVTIPTFKLMYRDGTLIPLNNSDWNASLMLRT